MTADALLTAVGLRSSAMRSALRRLVGDTPARRERLDDRAQQALRKLTARLELGVTSPQRLLAALQAAYGQVAQLLAGRLLGEPVGVADGALAAAIASLDPASAEALPPDGCDLLGPLYHQLLPRPVRHALGETYTPGWLARLTVDLTLGELDAPRVLDPACGSGAFLGVLIRRARERRPDAPPEALLAQVAGIDVNPLAAEAARAACLVALGSRLAQRSGPLALPVVTADTVRLPWESPGELPEPLQEPFDAVVGNPPWVNWEHLPPAQRRATAALWRRYGLFPKQTQGLKTILGGAKYDLAALLTCRVADQALKPGGRLGFVLNRAVFKTAGAGQGFRRFALPDGTPLAPVGIDDVTDRRPFPEVPVQPVIALFEKGRPVSYPVPWRTGGSDWLAEPVDPADATSAWLSAPASDLQRLRRVLGPSAYTAREGANTGGANGILWLRVESERPGGRLAVVNAGECGRPAVPTARGELEAELLYPLLRGQDVQPWHAEPSLWLLLPHRPGQRLKAIAEDDLEARCPGAAAYLEPFRKQLAERPLRRRYFRASSPFYALFNVGDYTFAPHKVVWREQGERWAAAVVGAIDGRPVVADHKLMQVAVDSADEAHYLCAALNSAPVAAAVLAYTQATARSVHVLDHVAIPRYDAAQTLHRELAELSRQAHAGEPDDDRLAALAEGLWVNGAVGQSRQCRR